MTWEPLTRTFCAESVKDGVLFAHTYDAPDIETARKIALKYGWSFLGELPDEWQDLEEEAAILEIVLTDPVIH